MKSLHRAILLFALTGLFVFPQSLSAQKGWGLGFEVGTPMDGIGQNLLKYARIADENGFKVAFSGGTKVGLYGQYGFSDNWSLRVSILKGNRILEQQMPLIASTFGTTGVFVTRATASTLRIPVYATYRKNIFGQHHWYGKLMGGASIGWMDRARMGGGVGSFYQGEGLVWSRTVFQQAQQAKPLPGLLVGGGLSGDFGRGGILNVDLRWNWIPSREMSLSGDYSFSKSEFTVHQQVNLSSIALHLSYGFSFKALAKARKPVVKDF